MSNCMEAYATAIAKKSYCYTMQGKKFKAQLMKAPRLKTEVVCGLPPGDAIPIYPVDALPGCPKDWAGGIGSYVCPVSPDWGLWFDWTMNDRLNTAVLPSVKGLNPITGRPTTKGASLEQYGDKCPVHNEPLKSGRFCEKCDFKWPPQNYVAYPNYMWLDGWRQPDGTVRQFFFTEETIRDVASAVMGERETVPAFGFAFFEPQKRREVHVPDYPRAEFSPYTKCAAIGVVKSGGYFGAAGYSGCSGYSGRAGATKGVSRGTEGLGVRLGQTSTNFIKQHITHTSHPAAWQPSGDQVFGGSDSINVKGDDQVLCMFSADAQATYSNKVEPMQVVAQNMVPDMVEDMQPAKAALDVKVSVGAGAKISQDLQPDPLGVKDWKDAPSDAVRLYFVFEKEFRRIVKGGIRDLEGDQRGYLKGVPVG